MSDPGNHANISKRDYYLSSGECNIASLSTAKGLRFLRRVNEDASMLYPSHESNVIMERNTVSRAGSVWKVFGPITLVQSAFPAPAERGHVDC